MANQEEPTLRSKRIQLKTIVRTKYHIFPQGYVSPEEVAEQQIWWILQEIEKQKKYLTPAGEKVSFYFREGPYSTHTQKDLLSMLKSRNALDLEEIKSPTDPSVIEGFHLTFHEQEFFRLYEWYQHKFVFEPALLKQKELSPPKKGWWKWENVKAEFSKYAWVRDVINWFIWIIGFVKVLFSFLR